MRQSVFYLSVTTLGLLGFVALATVHGPDPGPDVLLLWAAASLAALLTVSQSAAASVQGRQLAWLAAFLAAGLVSILGLVVTFLIPTYPNWMLAGIRLVDLIDVAPFLPACAGVVGLVYSVVLWASSTPPMALSAGDGRASGASSPPPPVGAWHLEAGDTHPVAQRCAELRGACSP